MSKEILEISFLCNGLFFSIYLLLFFFSKLTSLWYKVYLYVISSVQQKRLFELLSNTLVYCVAHNSQYSGVYSFFFLFLWSTLCTYTLIRIQSYTHGKIVFLAHKYTLNHSRTIWEIILSCLSCTHISTLQLCCIVLGSCVDLHERHNNVSLLFRFLKTLFADQLPFSSLFFFRRD